MMPGPRMDSASSDAFIIKAGSVRSIGRGRTKIAQSEVLDHFLDGFGCVCRHKLNEQKLADYSRFSSKHTHPFSRGCGESPLTY